MLTKEQKKLAKKELKTWETRVDVMGYFEMPENYKANTETGKYARFTGFLKEWMTELLTSKDANSPFAKLGYDKDNLPENWWNVAMKVGRGKNVENTLPQLPDFIVDDADKETVFNTLLPAYRALTEKFEKRSVFQWIFNHSQYTAERDSINVLKGVITTLTKCTPEELDSKLKTYQDNIKNSGRDEDERESESDAYKAEMKLKRIAIKEAAKMHISPEEWLDIQNGALEQKEFDKVDKKNNDWKLEHKGYDDDFVDFKIGNDVKESANVSQDDLNESRPIEEIDDDIFNKSFEIEKGKSLDDDKSVMKK